MPPSYALLLAGSARNAAPLAALWEAVPALRDQPWTAYASADPGPGGLLLEGPLTPSLAGRLRKLGLRVVRVEVGPGGGLSWAPVGDATEPKAGGWSAYARRDGASLAEALLPAPLPRSAPTPEAAFFLAEKDGAAHDLLSTLAALGRADVGVVDAPGDALWVYVPEPPLHVLLRAREGALPGVRAYARAGEGELWVEDGYAHPLGAQLSAAVAARGGRVWLGADGARGVLPAARALRDLGADLAGLAGADFGAGPVARVSPTESRFPVAVRLVPAAGASEPELWLLSPRHRAQLEVLVEGLSPDEIQRFTLTSFEGPDGRGSLLRELVKPGRSRLGLRVSEILADPGYARDASVEALFLPVGRRLAPPLRRDRLRELFGTEGMRAVVVVEGPGGPTVVHVPKGADAPLADAIAYGVMPGAEWRAASERSVFDAPTYEVATAPAAPADRRRPVEEEPTRPPPPVRAPRAPAAGRRGGGGGAPAGAARESDEVVRLRAEAGVLEGELAEGGRVDPAPWDALAALKLRLDDRDEAAACLEAAIFYGPTRPRIERLAALHARPGGAETDEQAAALLANPAPLPGAAAALGARALEIMSRPAGAPTPGEEFFKDLAERFSAPDLPVSRHLAWAVLRATHARSGDALELTRSKERVLRGVNTRGMSDVLDLPRFVRAALARRALGGEARAAEAAALGGGSASALDGLWREFSATLAPLPDPLAIYGRLTFAMGLSRLGAPGRARDLLAEVEAVASAVPAPTAVLIRLYTARIAHEMTRGTDQAWNQEVEAQFKGKSQVVIDRAGFLRKRSAWLADAGVSTDVPTTLRPGMDPLLARGEAAATPEEMIAALTALLGTPAQPKEVFDYERVAILRRLLRAAREKGGDFIAPVVAVAADQARTQVKGPGRQVDVLGECIEAAALAGDTASIDKMLDDIAARASSVQSSHEIMRAMKPALASMRRLGARESAVRFLEAMSASGSGSLGSVLVRATLAEGWRLLRDETRATAMLDEALDALFVRPLPEYDRVRAGLAVMASLTHWPFAERVTRARKGLANVTKMTDSFTSGIDNPPSNPKLYNAFMVFFLEGIIDAMSDTVTAQGDLVRLFLDEEELAFRRRVIEDARGGPGKSVRSNPGRPPPPAAPATGGWRRFFTGR